MIETEIDEALAKAKAEMMRNLVVCVSGAKVKHFLTPSGRLVEFWNVTRCCELLGLNVSSMRAVASGRQKVHKGWRAPRGIKQ